MDQDRDSLGPQALVLDIDSNASENDSAIGLSNASSTQSLRSSLFESVEENGRTYHKYKEGRYYLPNDETEQNRLDIQHQLFMLTLDGNLHLAPVTEPRTVLDIGTGTGNWALDFGKSLNSRCGDLILTSSAATKHPESKVVGTELSAIQPDYIPENCSFLIDDAEDEWTFAHQFDFIHGRALFSCFTDHKSVFQKAYDALAPGGYFEMQDVYFKPASIDGTIEGTQLQMWNSKLIECATMIGRDWLCVAKYAQWFREVGLQDVVEKVFYWPLNTWPKGKKQKLMGMCTYANGTEGLEAISLAMLSRVMKMSSEEIEALMRDVRLDMANKKIHGYYRVYVVYGRKPL